MTDIDIANDKIRWLIRTALDWPENTVRPAYQNAPTGKNSDFYATVLLTNLTGSGWDANRLANDSATAGLKSDTVGQRQATAQIQFYRLGAYKTASALSAILQRQSTIQTMSDIGIGLVRVGQVTNVSKVINTTWEEQASVNADFNLISIETETLTGFIKFPIQITPDTPAGTQSTISTEVFEP